MLGLSTTKQSVTIDCISLTIGIVTKIRRVPTEDITKKVKAKALEFDGSLNPSAFLDWLASMEDYFEWYNMNDAQRVWSRK